MSIYARHAIVFSPVSYCVVSCVGKIRRRLMAMSASFNTRRLPSHSASCRPLSEHVSEASPRAAYLRGTINVASRRDGLRHVYRLWLSSPVTARLC